MCPVAPSPRLTGRALPAALLPLALIAVLTRCQDPVRPVAPPTPPANASDRASLQRLGFVIDVNLRSGRMVVSAMSGPDLVSSVQRRSASSPAAPDFSLLGLGVVELTASNYSAGAVGAVSPGKIAVRLDVRVRNLLSSLRLVTSTFPAPPVGAIGVQLLPFAITVLTTTTGTGQVLAGPQWDGAPHNFFNDNGCTQLPTDCLPYEPFPSLEPLTTSAPRTIDFLVDPSVQDFRVTLLLAAELQAVSGG